MEKSKIRIILSLFVIFALSQISYLWSFEDYKRDPEDYLGRDYKLGYPPNKGCQYGGGGIWNVEGSEWWGSLDCSGLLSWCKGLRKHYFTDELMRLTYKIKWKELEPGDILIKSDEGQEEGHVLIFCGWAEKVGNDPSKWVVKTIHAVDKIRIPQAYAKAVGEAIISKDGKKIPIPDFDGKKSVVYKIEKVVKQNFRVDFCKLKKWFPRRFRETKGPAIKLRRKLQE